MPLASAAVSMKGRVEGRIILRMHCAARPGHPLGVLGADVGVALEVLVYDGEAERQVDLRARVSMNASRSALTGTRSFSAITRLGDGRAS